MEIIQWIPKHACSNMLASSFVFFRKSLDMVTTCWCCCKQTFFAWTMSVGIWLRHACYCVLNLSLSFYVLLHAVCLRADPSALLHFRGVFPLTASDSGPILFSAYKSTQVHRSLWFDINRSQIELHIHTYWHSDWSRYRRCPQGSAMLG